MIRKLAVVTIQEQDRRHIGVQRPNSEEVGARLAGMTPLVGVPERVAGEPPAEGMVQNSGPGGQKVEVVFACHLENYPGGLGPENIHGAETSQGLRDLISFDWRYEPVGLAEE